MREGLFRVPASGVGDHVVRRSQILSGVAETLVQGDVSITRAPLDPAVDHFADLADDVGLRELTRRDREEQITGFRKGELCDLGKDASAT